MQTPKSLKKEAVLQAPEQRFLHGMWRNHDGAGEKSKQEAAERNLCLCF